MKKVRISKRIVSVGLIFLLSINCFAKSVGDNDGSAFITKAEFDSLKGNFQSQIDSYNQSIDSKIDVAIASYLGGLNIAKKPIDYISKYKAAANNSCIWIYGLPGYGAAYVIPQEIVNSRCSLNREVCNNIELHFYHVGIKELAEPWGSMYWGAAYTIGTPVWSSVDGFARYYYAYFNKPADDSGADNMYRISYKWNAPHVLSQDLMQKPKYLGKAQRPFSPNPTYVSEIVTAASTTASDGYGSGWISQYLDGYDCLKYYANSIYPSYTVNTKAHFYKKYDVDNDSVAYVGDLADQGAGGTILKAADAGVTPRTVLADLLGSDSAGTDQPDNSKTAGNYIDISTSIVKTTDGFNYINYVFAMPNAYIYGCDEEYTGENTGRSTKTITLDTTNLTYLTNYYGDAGKSSYTSKFPALTYNYIPLNYKMYETTIGDFCNHAASVICGEPVYNGEGIPIFETQDDDKEVTLDIKLKDENGGVSVCQVIIASEKFVDGNPQSGTTIANFNCQTGTKISKKITITKKGIVWVFIKHADGGYNTISIDSCEVK